MTKYEKYEELKKGLIHKSVKVDEYQEINYGIQFNVHWEDKSSKIRIYESKKKGLTVDLSQIKYEEFKMLIHNINNGDGDKQVIQAGQTQNLSDDLNRALIGVDESGKGDYFGPLVIAGVYADYEMKKKLIQIGAADSKTLNDTKIAQLADRIKKICPYEIICLNNETYNKLYEEIKNLNYLLAWGHSKVIEKLADKTHCDLALSDQFGDEKLIKNQLLKRQIEITLEQRPRAEENVVVAAASILARDAFVRGMKLMEQKHHQDFPKGAGPGTIRAAQYFATTYGKSKLIEVAKLHFKTTEKI